MARMQVICGGVFRKMAAILVNENVIGPYCQIHKCEYLAEFMFRCSTVKSHVAMTCDFHMPRGVMDHLQVCDSELSVRHIAKRTLEEEEADSELKDAMNPTMQLD